jgi:hypothetical protein
MPWWSEQLAALAPADRWGLACVLCIGALLAIAVLMFLDEKPWRR